MLTNYYTALHVECLRAGPVGSYLDDFAAWLARHSYRLHTVRLLIRGAVCFAEWAAKEGHDPTDTAAADAYLGHLKMTGRYRRRAGGARSTWARGTQLFMDFLVDCGMGAPAAKSPEPPRPMVDAYRTWMLRHRGVRESTVEVYRPVVERLLDRLGDQPEGFSAEGIRDFVLELASEHGVAKAQTTVTAVRSFLRFAIASGRCAPEMLQAVPTVAGWKLASMPRYIGADEVERLIDSCDVTKLVGLRDRAVLLLLARLAMRAGDVAGLRFRDIDWLHGCIRVSGKSRREVWLPLPQDVGDALEQWLTHGRPEEASDHVFTKVVAPLAPLSRWQVSSTVKRALKRTGIDAPSQGAHLLRHSAATAMLAEGATLHEIGSVLRHTSIETTYHYAKVDMAMLRMVAAPWPELPEAPMPDARVNATHVRAIAMPWPEVAPC
jgi:site-specific recombinase XerD